VELGRIYGCELNLERGRELALSLAKTLAGLGLIKGSTQLIATSLQLNLATMVISRAIQGITAAYLTYIAGRSFIEYFRQNQDWGDGGMTEVVQRQFQLNRRDEFLKSFIQDAMTKVIQPLAESLDRSPQGNTTQASAAMLQATETRILPATTRPVVNLSPDLSAVDLSAVDLSPTENGDWNLSDRFTADWDD
jgi:uncharacterized protein (DUF697 family)